MARTPQKLLFICQCTPDIRGTGWEQRAYSFLSAYARLMDIDLWFRPTFDNPEMLRASATFNLCKSVVSFHPLLLSRNAYHLRDRLHSALANAECVHIGRCLEIVSAINHRSILWDIDELPPKLRGGSEDAVPVPADAEKTEFERIRAAWRASRIVFSSSPLERLAKFKDPLVVPNTHFRSIRIGRNPSPGTLLFVGNLNFKPNIDGIFYFESEILPLLRPEITLTIVGRRPFNPELRTRFDRLKDNGRIELFYDVEECAPYYDRSMASIAPIRTGAGTRVKIVEAFASMCPVISTVKGCEGLSVADGRELLVCDSPADFAAACTKLLDDSALSEKIAKTAYEFYLERLSQGAVDKIIESAVTDLLPDAFH